MARVSSGEAITMRPAAQGIQAEPGGYSIGAYLLALPPRRGLGGHEEIRAAFGTNNVILRARMPFAHGTV